MIATILPALLAASLPASTDVDLQVQEIFRPYKDDRDDKAPWDRPIFSKEITALIAHWQGVLPRDEPDRLNDGDWLCQCQDWDAEGFKVTVLKAVDPAAVEPPEAAVATRDGASAWVDVKIDLGFGPEGVREAQLRFKREEDAWKLDDLYASDSFPEGLKQALRETIAEDEALAASRRK